MGPLRRLGVDVPRVRGHWRWFRGRSGLLLLALALGLYGFLSGVGTTDRPGIPQLGFLAKLYYTIGLFILGGVDLGTPTGGPALGRAALWLAYFIAPTLTATAVVETILLVLRTDALFLRRLKDHIVVAGCGRMTQLYLERLRESGFDRGVVVVGAPQERATFDELREVYGAQIVEGDITNDALLLRLRLEHAARILLFTDDDFINLDAAARISSLAPEAAEHVIVHVSDLHLMRSVAATRLAQRCQVFNGHQIAAAHLVNAHLAVHFKRTIRRDLVVLAGFGRFGQSVLGELQKRAPAAFDRVVVVDLDGSQRAAIFAEQVGFSGDYRREIVDGDIQDPTIWAEVERRIDLSEVAPVFIVGSGLDRIDLRIAMSLVQRYPQALVIARSDRQWSFTETFSRESGIHVFSVAKLVTESMPDAWFGPRTAKEVPLDPSRVAPALAE